VTVATAAGAAPVVFVPRWPLFAAPVVGLVYYATLSDAFLTAIKDVVSNTSDLDQAFQYGTHWIYHLFAEAVSITFGTFVAGGMARERAATGGLIGGCTISLGWAMCLAIAFHFSFPLIPGEPWYQYYVIGPIVVVAAPIIGYQLGDMSREISTDNPRGFSGIPRVHFLWLWFPAYWYAAAMIGPFLKVYMNGLFDWTPSLLLFALYLIPLGCFVAPLVVGLTFLSGKSAMRPAFGQEVGTLVLVVGWWVAAAIQYGVIQLVNWL
jgi:hypothetical protein